MNPLSQGVLGNTSVTQAQYFNQIPELILGVLFYSLFFGIY